MFLKHRSAWIAALTLLAAATLTLGLFCLRTYRLDLLISSTETFPSAASDDGETIPSPACSVSVDGVTITTPTGSFFGNGETVATSVVPVVEPEQTSPGWLMACIVLFLLGSAAAVLLVFFCAQRKPLLGPALDLAALVLAFSVCADWQRFMLSSFWMLIPPATVLALAAVRELWGWLRSRCPLDWLLTHRIAVFFADSSHRSGVYLLALCLPVSVLPPFCAYAFIVDTRPAFYLAGFGILVLLADGILLVRFAHSVSHLTRQIGQLHAGGAITVGRGALAQWEARLAALGAQRDEAIQTAVTSERFKVELISNVSHDLRTPLTAILGYSELLRQEPLSEVGAAQLKRLCEKAGYMRELIDELFELTKVSSGAAQSRQERLDLIRLLEQTVGMYDDALTAAHLEVRRHYAAAQIPLVSDGTRLHQIFSNLLGNAVKYALPGTRIHLTVSPEADGWCIRMTNVAAYEMDFDPAEIVQRFARGDKARSTRGSGLGLAIAQTYSESLGGSFRVEIHEEQFSAVVCLPNNERDL